MDSFDTAITILGLGAVTLLTRAFFLLPRHELPLPALARRALKYAPLAALVAILVPEIVMSHGQLISTWADARPIAAVCAVAYYTWRRGILGTIAVGMLVFVPLRIGLGW